MAEFDSLAQRMTRNRRPKEAWEIFQEAFVPREASEAQRFDLKRAFYGGMGALLLALRNAGGGGEKEIIEEVAAFLNGKEDSEE